MLTNQKFNQLMRSQNYSVFIMIISLLAGAGCKDKKEEAVKPMPTIVIDSISGSTDKTSGYYSTGDNITLDYTATAGEGLNRIVITETSSSGQSSNSRTITNFDTPTMDKGTHRAQITSSGNLTIRLDVFDAKGTSASASFVAKTVLSYSDVVLGAQLGNAGSYYASSENKVYKGESDFEANKGKIDITYAYLNNAPTIISSDQRNTDQVNSGKGAVKTYFRERTGMIDFNAVKAADLASLVASDQQKIVVEEGKIYEFVSPTTGAKGLIKITDYNDGNGDATGSSIKFDVKIVQ
jgi:hypothetical protein